MKNVRYVARTLQLYKRSSCLIKNKSERSLATEPRDAEELIVRVEYFEDRKLTILITEKHLQISKKMWTWESESQIQCIE